MLCFILAWLEKKPTRALTLCLEDIRALEYTICQKFMARKSIGASYACRACQMRFLTEYGLSNHVRKIHQETIKIKVGGVSKEHIHHTFHYLIH